MGVGSQRAMLENPELEASFSIVREHAPTAFIAANIGGAQLASGWTDLKTRRLIDAIRADAVIVHLNPAQELVQPEGDRSFRGILAGIRRMVEDAGVPVIVKETGAGISGEVAVKLMDAGVAAVDVAGAGGTSWSRVEAWRRDDGDHSLDEWGIPTVDCLLEVAPLRSSAFRIIASGGVRTAEDALKCLCLGADMAAMAQPIIAVVKSDGLPGLHAFADRFTRELVARMLLIGCATVSDCQPTHLRILGQ
jgi:isopentenyl-diphosphate delta-isomerase